MNVYLAKFMTYFEIHRMHREGHSISKISEFLVLNRRTVSKYLSMSESKLPVVKAERQFQQLEETPYGKQAQVDFGEYNMR